MEKKWKLIVTDSGRGQIYEGKEWNIVVVNLRAIENGALRGFIFDAYENYSNLADDELIKKFGDEIVLRVYECNEECDDCGR